MIKNRTKWETRDKCENVSPKGEHVPLEEIRQRIEWIKQFTNAESVTLLGGEPLLHPQFKEIADFVLEQGLSLEIITSGKVSKKVQQEIVNREYMLDLYEQGKLKIELSFQPGRNNGEYLELSQDIIRCITKRKENLRAKKEFLEKDKGNAASEKELKKVEIALNGNDIVTTATLDKTFTEDKEKFTAVCKFLLNRCFGYNWDSVTIKDGPIADYIDQTFLKLQKHFLPFEESQFFVDTLRGSSPSNVTFQVRFWGANRIIPVAWEIANDREFMTSRVDGAKGTEEDQMICPSMHSNSDRKSKTVNLATITIRTDGEATFSTPACISSKSGLCNAGVHQNRNDIFAVVSSRLQQTRDVVIRAKQKEAGDNNLERCKVDPKFPDTDEGHQKVCPSCPVHISCNFCHVRETDW